MARSRKPLLLAAIAVVLLLGGFAAYVAFSARDDLAPIASKADAVESRTNRAGGSTTRERTIWLRTATFESAVAEVDAQLSPRGWKKVHEDPEGMQAEFRKGAGTENVIFLEPDPEGGPGMTLTERSRLSWQEALLAR